jgi:hypothetical protein
MWGGWGIYSPNHQKWLLESCCRMAHRTVRCATGHYPVRQPRQQTVGVRPLELWQAGSLGCPVVHRTGPVDCLVRQLRVLFPLRAQAHIKCVAVDRCARSSRCSPGTPESPVDTRHCLVLHRTVQWIIAERPPDFPKVVSFSIECPGAPDSPVRQTRVPFGMSVFVWTLSWSFYLAYCEPLAPVELID